MGESASIKVSVIMPSLNVREYIEECLKSVLNQTLDEIEIICIDAESTDGTFEVLKKYADMPENRDRMLLFQSDVKSYGYQVNLGIKKARGKYIAVLETDDYIESCMYEELYQLAEYHNADVAKADYASFFEIKEGKYLYQRVSLWENDSTCYDKVLCPQRNAYLYLHDQNIWKGIYNREFLIKNEIWLNESKGAAFQDIGFAHLVFSCAERVVYTDKSYYRYRLGREMSSVNSVKSFMFAYQEFYRLLTDESLYKKLVYMEGIYSRMLAVVLTEYPKVLRMTGYNMESEYIKPYYAWFRIVLLDALEKKYLQIENMDNFLSNGLMEFLYENDKFILKTKEREEIDKKFLKDVSGKKVYIFGAGRLGERLMRWLFIRGIMPICLCDNNKELWGKKLCTVNILSPSESILNYIKEEGQKIFVIANRYHSTEIMEQLIQSGIPQSDIIERI